MPHEHDFHPVSGWCSRCSLRDDGRLVSFDGIEYRPGPDYTPDQIMTFLTRGRTQ